MSWGCCFQVELADGTAASIPSRLWHLKVAVSYVYFTCTEYETIWYSRILEVEEEAIFNYQCSAFLFNPLISYVNYCDWPELMKVKLLISTLL